MSNKQGWLSAALLGKNPDESSPTYTYQRRQTKLIFSSAIPALFWVGLIAYTLNENLTYGLTLAFAVLYAKLHFTTAASADAIFDSLWERINLQSRWLNSRLTHLEDVMKAQGKERPWGQQLWAENESYDGQLNDAWNSYPEKESRLS